MAEFSARPSAIATKIYFCLYNVCIPHDVQVRRITWFVGLVGQQGKPSVPRTVVL